MVMADMYLLITGITLLHRGQCGPLCVLLRVAMYELYIKEEKKKKKEDKWNNKNSVKVLS